MDINEPRKLHAVHRAELLKYEGEESVDLDYVADEVHQNEGGGVLSCRGSLLISIEVWYRRVKGMMIFMT